MWFEIVSLVILGYLLYTILKPTSPPLYWKEHGIKYIDCSVVASNVDILMGKKSIMNRDDYAYEKMGSAHKFCGVLETPSPVIILKDVDLIKKILIKDFDHFVNRRDFFFVADREKNIMTKVLGMLRGEKWKGVRTTISPTFTTGKIRRVMEHFNIVGQEWIEMLKKNSDRGSTEIDVLKSVNQYSVEVIARSVFGMRSGTIQNPNTIFCKMANRLSEIGILDALKLNMCTRYPKLMRALGFNGLDMNAVGFFTDILKQNLEQRLNGSVERNDYLQLLVEAKKGQLKAVGSDELDDFEKEALLGEGHKGKYLTNDVIVANSFAFYIAGFQTTATVIGFSIYILAANPDIQDKLREEVARIIKEDGSVNYDDLGQLTYMDMFISEVLRYYPPIIRLEREAVKD